MRKLAIIAGVVFALAAASLASVYYSRNDKETWPLSEDPVCAAVMAARAPDLVFSSEARTDDLLILSARWSGLDHAAIPLVQLTGYLQRGEHAVVLYASYERAYRGWASGSGIVADADPSDWPVRLSTGGLWPDLPPAVLSRCVVAEGAYAPLPFGGSSLTVTRLRVWVEPHRPQPDFTFLRSEFEVNVNTAQPVDAWQ
jgi:hypothetical protein